MEFSSIFFIYFVFPIFTLIYYIIPKKHSQTVLFVLSLIFVFMSGIYAVAGVLAFIAVNYALCLAIDRLSYSKMLSRAVFTVDFVLNIIMVGICRYSLLEKLEIYGNFNSQLTFIGASFLAMSGIGFADEICSGEKMERNLIKFGLYIAYFPKLMLGPYISYKDFAANLEKSEKSLGAIGNGAAAFIKGLAKKVILADSIFKLWNSVNMLKISSISLLTAWLGVIAFGLCFYFTLSGITDMARGISLVFGIDLPRSFQYPLFSIGMSEFCLRWHTDIVKWFRNLTFIPVRKRTSNKVIIAIILMLLWCLVGIFYEWSVNKVIWGFIIGFSLTAEKALGKKIFGNLPAFLFEVLVTTLGWIFFMEDKPVDSLMYLRTITGGTGNIVDSSGIYLLKAYSLIVLIGIYFASDLFKNLTERSKGKAKVEIILSIVSPFAVMALLILSTSFIVTNGHSFAPVIKF